jgi:peptidyl-prolyl cis-trans isomerase-like 4
MSILLETVWGDLVIDLDIQGSPLLARNLVKLVKARYYTQVLFHTVHPSRRYAITGDPEGTGTGGVCIHGLGEANPKESNKRFLASQGRYLTLGELQEKGRVISVEMNGIKDTIGSQFGITLTRGDAEDLASLGETTRLLSLGVVAEDSFNLLDKLAQVYCDDKGRPMVDLRIQRALVVYDPFDDPSDMADLLKQRGVIVQYNKRDNESEESDNDDLRVINSPSPVRPSEETVPARIDASEISMDDNDNDKDQAQLEAELRQQEAEAARREDKGRAVVLELLGDLPDADIRAPENVLFVCKLNSITLDEDLELIFSRFDPNVKVEIIRDHETGNSLQYAFCEFTTREQASEAYFKMNNALVDDRRIKVDFSQSVAKIWDRYNQRMRMPPSRADGSFANEQTSGRSNNRQGRNFRHNNNSHNSSNNNYDNDRRGGDNMRRYEHENSRADNRVDDRSDSRGDMRSHYNHTNRDTSGNNYKSSNKNDNNSHRPHESRRQYGDEQDNTRDNELPQSSRREHDIDEREWRSRPHRDNVKVTDSNNNPKRDYGHSHERKRERERDHVKKSDDYDSDRTRRTESEDDDRGRGRERRYRKSHKKSRRSDEEDRNRRRSRDDKDRDGSDRHRHQRHHRDEKESRDRDKSRDRDREKKRYDSDEEEHRLRSRRERDHRSSPKRSRKDDEDASYGDHRKSGDRSSRDRSRKHRRYDSPSLS